MYKTVVVKYSPKAKEMAIKVEEAANKTEGVKNAVVNFMTLKMIVDVEDGVNAKEVMGRVLDNCKIVEDDCEIFF